MSEYGNYSSSFAVIPDRIEFMGKWLYGDSWVEAGEDMRTVYIIQQSHGMSENSIYEDMYFRYYSLIDLIIGGKKS